MKNRKLKKERDKKENKKLQMDKTDKVSYRISLIL